MKLWLRLTLVVAVFTIALTSMHLVNLAAAQSQIAAPAAGRKAGEFFKNVTTGPLKDLTVDDFLATMGVMTDALGFDCADCHPGAGTDKVDFAIDTISSKRTARRMIEMVAKINRENFGTSQKVTCFTCHHGRETPTTTIALDTLYSAPNMEDDDIVPAAVTGPTADQILDRYIQALGGAQRLNAITSFVATGASQGYGGFGGDGDFTIYAKSPNQRTVSISFKDHPERGESVWAFDGKAGWWKTPRGFFAEYEVVGEELDGLRLEAQIAFPGQIKTTLNNWRHGLNRVIDDKDYLVVQGSGPRGFLATFYFDPQTFLLRRMVRYGPSPAGRAPTQIDYKDYRDVGGIKFPYEYQFSWLDGRWTAKIKDVKTNVAIDAKKFGKP